MGIEGVKIRSRITIGDGSLGNTITAETGHGHANVLSFNVTKSRSSLSTFSASIKISAGEVTGTIDGETVKIYASGTEYTPGTRSISATSPKLIFTGVVKSAKITPVFDDPSYVLLSISGTTALNFLQGKRYTRRCRSTKSSWVAITNVIRKQLKSGKLEYRKGEAFDITDGPLSNGDGLIKTRSPAMVNNTVETPPAFFSSTVNLIATPEESV